MHTYRFSSASANDGLHKELYFQSAALCIPQLNRLLQHTRVNMQITATAHFANKGQEVLAELFR